jgi:hypothetical protein
MTSVQNINEKGERRCMQNSPCPDPMEHIETAGKIIGVLSGGIGLFVLIKKSWQKWREKHPTFRYTVVKSLEQIKEGQRRFEDFNAATLRERLGSLRIFYVEDRGWCTRDQKEKVLPLFDIYIENYAPFSDIPLVEKDKQDIASLPESKDQRIEFNQ